MAVNGSGIINTARVLKISPMIVTEELKKHRLHLVNKTRLAQLNSQPLEVLLRVKDPQPELDQIWSFVQPLAAKTLVVASNRSCNEIGIGVCS